MRIRVETVRNMAAMATLNQEFTIREFADYMEYPPNTARNLIKRYFQNGYLVSVEGTVRQSLPNSVKPSVIYERTVNTTYYRLTRKARDLLKDRKGTYTKKPTRYVANSVFNLAAAL